MSNVTDLTELETASLPIIFLVDADDDAREQLATALNRRFGADYRVLTANSAPAGIEALERFARQGTDVALVAADLHLPGMNGVEFLERVRALHGTVFRALLIALDKRGTRIPFGALGDIQRATALGRIDLWLVKGAEAPEELVYPHVQEVLSIWTRANRPRHMVFRVVGERKSPRSHALREALGRNTVPFGFFPVDTDEGRRLMRDHGVDAARLPAVILRDGSVMHDPSEIELAAALGVRTRPSAEVFDLAVVGAGPAGLAAAVYGASEGLRTLLLLASR